MEQRNIRFIPTEDNIVTIFHNDHVIKGLIRDESYSGICAIFHKEVDLDVGDDVDLSIGNLQGYTGEVVRREVFDSVLLKVGIKLHL